MTPLLADLLRARAAAEPDTEAFVVAGGDALTYRSWASRSDALGRGLLDRGVGAGDRVVLCFDARRWIDFAVTYAGVHKAGAVPVLLGPQAPDHVLVRSVSQSGASAVITSSSSLRPDVLGGTSAWLGRPAELEHGQGAEAASPATPSGLAHVSHRFTPLQAFRPAYRRTEEILSALTRVDAVPAARGAPFLHAFQPVTDGGSGALWMPLGRRHRPVVVLPTLDPDTLCALTAAHGAACWGLAPATAGWLLDSGALQRHDVASLVRLILLDGQAAPALRSRLAAHLPAASVVAAPAGADGATVRRTNTAVPVASSQEGMLWHEVFAPGSQNLPPLVRRYRGALDVSALERALAEIVRRHEPLRTTFEVRDGRPVQIVSPAEDWDLGMRDLTALDPDVQEAEVASLLAAVGRPFDLVSGPMFEASLVRLAPDDHLVVLRVHHAVYDDWSVGVFRRELSVLYRTFAGGEASPLAELPRSFSDFSLNQHRRLAGPEGAAELAWWKERLAGAPLSLQLPIDDPERPPGAPQGSAEPVSVDLGPELSAQLRALARRERTTLFMTLLAAFEVLVHRYTGQEDLLAASVVANRNRPELEAMVGCFTKKVLVRLDGSGDPTFADLLPRVRMAVVGALSHQDLPFDTVLQGTLGAAAAMHGLVPQAAVMFQGVTPHREEVLLPGLETSGYDTSATTTRTHFSAGDDDGGHGDALPWGAGLYLGTFLILSVIEDVDGISLAARGAFHRPSVGRLLATFETLLADIVAHPTRRISELRLLGDDEQLELVRALAVDRAPVGARAHQVFEDQVASHPARAAIVEGAGHLTYAELDARAEALAGRLRDRGVGRGSLVGLGAGCSVESVVAVLAAWKAGAGYVARNEGTVSSVSPTAPGSPEHPDAVALVVHRRGSPNGAGGVVIGHRGVVNLASGLEAAVFSPSGTCRTPAGVRVGLSAGPAANAFLRQIAALLAGHTLCLAEGPAAVVSGLRAGDIDVVDCSPGELRELVAAGLASALDARAGRAPTPVVVVGSPAPIDHDTWRLLRSLPAVRAHHLYGPPECSFGAAVAHVAATDARLTLGSPLGPAVAVVLDAYGAPASERVTGELFLDGTATSDRRLSTGQLARRLPEGRIELLGRTDDNVDLRGFRVDLARITRALRRCPGVGKVDVLLRDDVDGQPQLVARLAPAQGAEVPTLARLQAELWAQLPGYAWPAAMEVVGCASPPEGESATARLLSWLWAEAGGVDRMVMKENYWQSFSFLEAVSRCRDLGVALSDQAVTRNRTVANLATSWRAERLRTQGPEEDSTD